MKFWWPLSSFETVALEALVIFGTLFILAVKGIL